MEPILKVENLVKRYAKRNLVGAPQDFLALDNVSFTLSAGTTLAIVGESAPAKARWHPASPASKPPRPATFGSVD